MSKEKFSKVEVKSNKEDNSESSENTTIKSLLSFDVFFQKLTKEGRALPHHKAPMQRYAEQNGLVEAREDEFEKLFKSY